MDVKSDNFDIVIAGGAMTGSTLALILEQALQGELSIAIIEAHQQNTDSHPGFDARSIALSHGTVSLLKKYNLWQRISAVATSISKISVTDKGHAGMTDIQASDEGLEALGYVVELTDVGQIYAELIAEASSITSFCPNQVVDIKRSEQSVTITLDNGSVLTSALLVAADGALSNCCDQVDLPLAEHDFEQVALIANIGLSQPHQGKAFERFTKTGPLALLPMSDNRMSLVWCLSPENAQLWLSADEETFLHKLQDEFGWRLGKFIKVGKKSVYPLVMRSRNSVVSHRVVAIGNAAQTLHPIAGQGFNLGIRDAASLVEVLVKTRAEGVGLGSYQMLDQYKQRRAQDRTLTMAMTATLVHTFSNDWFPTTLGRNLGLMAFDTIPAIRHPLIKRTLGRVAR